MIDTTWLLRQATLHGIDLPVDNGERGKWLAVCRAAQAAVFPRHFAKCDKHGPESANAWGCPDCMAEARHRIAQLESELSAVRSVADESELNRELLKAAHGELAALRRRIAEAPVIRVSVSRLHGEPGVRLWLPDGVFDEAAICALAGKRVRLLEE